MVRKNVLRTDLILKYMEDNNLSKNKFCKICKISPSTLRLILAEEDSFGLMALWKIARVMNIQLSQFFSKRGDNCK